MSSKIIISKLLPPLPGVNELIINTNVDKIITEKLNFCGISFEVQQSFHSRKDIWKLKIQMNISLMEPSDAMAYRVIMATD